MGQMTWSEATEQQIETACTAYLLGAEHGIERARVVGESIRQMIEQRITQAMRDLEASCEACECGDTGAVAVPGVSGGAGGVAGKESAGFVDDAGGAAVS